MKIKLALSSLFVATALFNASIYASVVTYVIANYVVSDYVKIKYPLVFAHKVNQYYSDSVTAVVGLVINGANDSLVSTCSAKFGKTIRDDYAWNHIDEINQFLGPRVLLSQDPVQIYREHANRLKLQGL